MSKTPTVWLKVARNKYYANINGKQVALHKDKDEAERLLAKKLGIDSSITVSQLVELYLAAAKQLGRSEGTIRTYRYVLVNKLCRAFGDVPAEKLNPIDVWDLIMATYTNQSSRWNYRCRIVALFNWAYQNNRLKTNPMDRLGSVGVASRREEYVTPEEAQLLLGKATGVLRDVILVLWTTGARPSEILNATRDELKENRRALVRKRHKTSHRRKGPRIIYLTAEGWAIMDRPDPIFRNQRGRRYSYDSFKRDFARLCKSVGMNYTAYHLRHGFTTHALGSGVSIPTVMSQLGHQSPTLILSTYQHLTQDSQYIHTDLEKMG
jgi:integrase